MKLNYKIFLAVSTNVHCLKCGSNEAKIYPEPIPEGTCVCPHCTSAVFIEYVQWQHEMECKRHGITVPHECVSSLCEVSEYNAAVEADRIKKTKKK
jgi:H2-forming N5,N10-methylenetetrahydromethanopterin dehydrogenase-like enzyme